MALDRVGGGQRVAGRRELHADAAAGLPLRRVVVRVAWPPSSMRATSRSRTVEPSGLARSTMCAELLGRLELALDHDRGCMRWSPALGRSPSVPDDDLRVLRRDRGVDVVRRQVEADQLGRVDPDAHRALGAEQLRLADAGQALDLGQHVARRVVAEGDRVERRRRSRGA